jgi:hypothetical protein
MCVDTGAHLPQLEHKPCPAHIAFELLLRIEIHSNFSTAHENLNNKCAAAHGSAFNQRLDKHLSVETQPMSLSFPAAPTIRRLNE